MMSDGGQPVNTARSAALQLQQLVGGERRRAGERDVRWLVLAIGLTAMLGGEAQAENSVVTAYSQCRLEMRTPDGRPLGPWRLGYRGRCEARFVDGQIRSIDTNDRAMGFSHNGTSTEVFIDAPWRPNKRNADDVSYGPVSREGDCWIGERAKICLR
jgi:hypothetical protein